MTLHLYHQDRIGIVELDNPPVNAINKNIRAGLLNAVSWAENLKLERVIISGKGKAFAAGADAREFNEKPSGVQLPDVLKAISNSTVPWISASHGFCLGGGAEIMLACRYRIAHPKTRIGFPEVNLGIVPGSGGTQRLPRLIGIESALELVPTAKIINATEAQRINLIDAINDEPIQMGKTLDLTILTQPQLNPVEQKKSLFDQARRKAIKERPGELAPLEAIDLIQASQSLNLDQGLIAERQCFLKLRSSKQAQALRHMFFSERASKPPQNTSNKQIFLNRICIVGENEYSNILKKHAEDFGLIISKIENADLILTNISPDHEKSKEQIKKIKSLKLPDTPIGFLKLPIYQKSRTIPWLSNIEGFGLDLAISDKKITLMEINYFNSKSPDDILYGIKLSQIFQSHKVFSKFAHGGYCQILLHCFDSVLRKLTSSNLKKENLLSDLVKFGFNPKILNKFDNYLPFDFLHELSNKHNSLDHENIHYFIKTLISELENYLGSLSSEDTTLIDVLSVHLLGFPRWKGGIYYYFKNSLKNYENLPT